MTRTTRKLTLAELGTLGTFGTTPLGARGVFDNGAFVRLAGAGAPIDGATTAGESANPGLWSGCQWLQYAPSATPFETLIGGDTLTNTYGTPYTRETSDEGDVLGTTGGVMQGHTTPTEGLTELTMVAYFNLRGYPADDAGVMGTRLQSGPFVEFVIRGSDKSSFAFLQYDTGGEKDTVSSYTVPLGWQVWVARVSSTALDLFCAGQRVSSYAITPTVFSGTNPIVIGSYYDLRSSRRLDQQFAWGGIFDHAWTDAEIQQVTADPWALFRPATATSVAVNVAIAPGVYTHTPSALARRAGAASPLAPAHYRLTPKTLAAQAGTRASIAVATIQARGASLDAAAGMATALAPPLLQLRAQALLARAGTNVPVDAAVTAGRYANAGQTITARAGMRTNIQPSQHQLSRLALQLRAGARLNVDAATLALLPQALTAVAGSHIPVRVAIGSAKATLTGQAPEVIAGQLVAIAPGAHVHTAQQATSRAGMNAEIEAQTLTLQTMRFNVALNATGYLVADEFTITPILSADGFEIKPN